MPPYHAASSRIRSRSRSRRLSDASNHPNSHGKNVVPVNFNGPSVCSKRHPTVRLYAMKEDWDNPLLHNSNFDSSNNNDTSTWVTECVDENLEISRKCEEVTEFSNEMPLESSNDGSETDKYSYKNLLIFVGTTICIWLSEPTLSMVDTVCVGRKSSTLELAALGPATMVIDSAVYLLAFLSISTNNIVGQALALEREDSTKSLYLQRKAVSNALGLAACIGVFMAFLCGSPLSGPALLKWVAGKGNQVIVPAAMSYNAIRSVSIPASIVGMVAQAICLANLDTKTPALAVIMASVINIIGDALLCVVFSFGIRGAALATAVANMASCAVLLTRLRRNYANKMLDFSKTKREACVGMPSETELVENDIKKCEEVPFMSIPSGESLQEFVRLAGPIFFVIVGKLVCYSAMTFKAASFGLMELASHNIMLRLFFFYATFGDALSQSAQSFIPSLGRVTNDSPSKNGNNNNKNQSSNSILDDKIRKLMKKFIVIGSFISLINSQVARYILVARGATFTTENSIISIMRATSKWMGFSLILHPFIMLFEGSIIARRDLKYLVGTYATTMGLMMLQLRSCSSFEGVWISLFVFQAIRLSQFGWRAWEKTLKKTK